jgi:hypothetical protein
MNAKRWLVLGAFGLALVVNPYLACSSRGESDFTYSEEEMKSAGLGTWQGSALLDGESVPFSLTLEQGRAAAAGPGPQPQCASRSFVKPAGACITVSRMPVVGTLTSEHPSLNGSVDGELSAGRNLDAIQVSLHVEGGAVLTGSLEGDALKEGRISAPLAGTFSLQRP